MNVSPKCMMCNFSQTNTIKYNAQPFSDISQSICIAIFH